MKHVISFKHHVGNHVNLYNITLIRERTAIVTEACEGRVAIDECKLALRQFDRMEGQHPSTVYRFPSLVYVDRSVCEQIALINGLKSALRERMMMHKERQRNVYARKAWPGISVLQLYRHINCFDQHPRKALFSWIGRTTSVSRPFSIEECVDKIKRTAYIMPSSVTKEEWSALIEKDIMDVESMANSPGDLVIVKPVAPHPTLVVYMNDEPDGVHVPANVPTFVMASSAPSEIVALQDFDFSTIKTRKKRKDSTHYAPVIPRLNLFLRPAK